MMFANILRRRKVKYTFIDVLAVGVHDIVDDVGQSGNTTVICTFLLGDFQLELPASTAWGSTSRWCEMDTVGGGGASSRD